MELRRETFVGIVAPDRRGWWERDGTLPKAGGPLRGCGPDLKRGIVQYYL